MFFLQLVPGEKEQVVETLHRAAPCFQYYVDSYKGTGVGVGSWSFFLLVLVAVTVVDSLVVV